MGNDALIEERSNLTVLPQEINPELLAAIKRLVHDKYRLDRWMSGVATPRRFTELYGNYNDPLQADSFFRKVFPFIPTWQPSGPTFRAWAPTDLTIGCSWRWRPDNVIAEEVGKLIAEFSDPVKNTRNTDVTAYMWIRPLGILLPSEGKNRVDFMRENKVDSIPANVTPYAYPIASRLQVCSILIHGRNEKWAVLDGRWIERLEYPEWSLPVLSAYGVVTTNLPDDFPAAELIAAAFESSTSKVDGYLSESVIDAELVKSKIQFASEPVACALTDVIDLRFNWHMGLLAVMAGFVTTAVYALLNDSASLGIALGSFAIGIAVTVGVQCAYPNFIVPRWMKDFLVQRPPRW